MIAGWAAHGDDVDSELHELQGWEEARWGPLWAGLHGAAGQLMQYALYSEGLLSVSWFVLIAMVRSDLLRGNHRCIHTTQPKRMRVCVCVCMCVYLCIYIYIYMYPGELPHYPPLNPKRSYPTTHVRVTPLSTRELPHYPHKFRTANIGIWEIWGLFAVSETMWVLVMVFLNMQVGCLKNGPFLTLQLDMTSRSWVWCRGANNKTL